MVRIEGEYSLALMHTKLLLHQHLHLFFQLSLNHDKVLFILVPFDVGNDKVVWEVGKNGKVSLCFFDFVNK